MIIEDPVALARPRGLPLDGVMHDIAAGEAAASGAARPTPGDFLSPCRTGITGRGYPIPFIVTAPS